MSKQLCTEVSTDFHSVITIRGDLLNLLNVKVGELLIESMKSEDENLANEIKHLMKLDEFLFTTEHVGSERIKK